MSDEDLSIGETVDGTASPSRDVDPEDVETDPDDGDRGGSDASSRSRTDGDISPTRSPPTDVSWHELSDDEKAAYAGTGLPAEDDASGDDPGTDDPAAVDWAQFVTRFGFDTAGDGVQDPWVTASTLALAIEVSDQISAAPDTFIQRAADHDDAPLIELVTRSEGVRRWAFREEVRTDD